MLYLKLRTCPWDLCLGQQYQGVYWMCTEYRLSVTPEKIVVQDRDNRGHFLQQWAAGCLDMHCIITAMQNCYIQ